MSKKTSNYDLSTFEVERFLEKSEKGVKVEILSKISNELEKKWLPKKEVRVGKYDQRISEIENYEHVDKIKIPYWLALNNNLI